MTRDVLTDVKSQHNPHGLEDVTREGLEDVTSQHNFHGLEDVTGDGLEDVTNFTYLCSNVDKQEGGGGGDDAYVKVRTDRARAAFLQIKNILASPNLTHQHQNQDP